jgi:hypothetical protein
MMSFFRKRLLPFVKKDEEFARGEYAFYKVLLKCRRKGFAVCKVRICLFRICQEFA